MKPQLSTAELCQLLMKHRNRERAEGLADGVDGLRERSTSELRRMIAGLPCEDIGGEEVIQR